MTEKIPLTVVHYGRYHPDEHLGGVETFARGLQRIFDEVLYMTPHSRTLEQVVARGLPVICDNQLVCDWPAGFPVIGFQHGVAQLKAPLTGSRHDKRNIRAQQRAAQRPLTLWVACAQWISRAFDELLGNPASHVVYHFVDTEQFDGQRLASASRLILHDARTPHKGREQLRLLARTFKSWRFEALDCPHSAVAQRMREARAFVHLSQFEGNSIVVNEAMAMNLPCLLTRVGLMQDRGQTFDTFVIEPELAFGAPPALLRQAETFLDSLATRHYQPRIWIMQHATLAACIQSWSDVMESFQRRFAPQLERQ